MHRKAVFGGPQTPVAAYAAQPVEPQSTALRNQPQELHKQQLCSACHAVYARTQGCELGTMHVRAAVSAQSPTAP